MPTKKQSKKTNLNLKIFLASIFLISFFSFTISSNVFASCGDGTIDSGEECDFGTNGLDSCRSKNSWCNGECKCQPWCVSNCECAKNLTAGQSCSDGCGQNCYGSNPKPANTCGNDIKEGSEECDFNSAFGPYPNQCANKCPCNQSTCKCSSGGTASTTSTPTATATPNPSTNSNPTIYKTIHDPYFRVDEKYTAFTFGETYEALTGGYIPYFRIFIPPGMKHLDLLISEGANRRMSISRYKAPPTTSLPTSYSEISRTYSLAQLEANDCLSTETLQGDLYIARDAFSSPYLGLSRGGWLYVMVSGGYSQVYYTHATVEVDTKAYNAWWDKYIKDEAGWNKYIENVETYIDPTIETKTPTCKADFSKTEITAPGESKLSFSSENTTKLIGSCTGLLPIEELELPLSYADYSFPFTTNQAGTETCTFTPYNGTIKGENCSATVTVKNSTASTPKPKPAEYVNLHDPYFRAPENSTTYTFAQTLKVLQGGYMPYLRVFIPPGTIVFDLQIKEGGGKQMAMSHYKTPPTTPLPSGYSEISKKYTLDQLETGDCLSTESLQGNLYIAHDSFLSPYLLLSRGGWLYANVGGGSYAEVYYNYFTVEVDTKTYNEWWDKYIKDEAGWNKYIENVETYVDPTTEIQTSPTPTPTPTSTPSLTATISNLDANFTITNGTSCINYMCDTTTKTMVASKEDFEYQKSFVCHYTKAGNYTASIECPNSNIITKVVTVKNPAQSLKACKRDNPDCEKLTCNNVYCDDGCERKQGTRVCDGK